MAARRVSLSFSLPDHPEVDSTLELERGEDGIWRAAGTALAIDGTWDVTVLVEGPVGSVEVPLQVTPESREQNIQVSRAQGQPDIYTITLADGVSIQAYVDPGIPGRPSQVHVTAFDADGNELPVHDAVLQIAQPDGSTVTPGSSCSRRATSWRTSRSRPGRRRSTWPCRPRTAATS